MLAIDYTNNLKLYHRYGLHARTVIDRTKLGNANVTYLSIFAQHQLHANLYNRTKKHNGNLRNAKLYANAISTGTNIKDRINVELTSNVVRVDHNMQVVKKRKKKQVNLQDEIFELADDDLNDFGKINKITAGYGVEIVNFCENIYEMKRPDYVNQLLPYSRLHNILVTNGIPDYSNIYIKAYFKQIFIITTLTEQLNSKISPDTHVIYNKSFFSNEALKRKFNLSKFEFIFQDSIRVTFATNNGKRDFDVDFPIISDRFKVGMNYIEVYDMMLLKGRRCSPLQSDLRQMSSIIKIKGIPKMLPRPETVAKLTKFIQQINDPLQSKVVLVIIGNKGSGKSGVTKKLKELFKIHYNLDVGIISSDLYGKWAYLRDKAFLTLDVDYNTLSYLNDDDSISIYEDYANEILEKYAMNTLGAYNSSSFKMKSKMINEMHQFLFSQIDPKDFEGERSFMSKIITSKTSPRVMIVEGHFVAQEAYLGRSDLVMQIQTVNDNLNAIEERDRASIAETLLYDSYFRLESNLHTRFYPVELFSVFKGFEVM